MKKWKSILSAALAGIMILSTVVSVGAANVSFTDISSHWAKSQINYLVSKDVLNGYKQNNGTYIFKPDGTVTRAEFIKMLDETFGLTATAPINYSDVKASDWFHPYISKAAAQGYLLNYGTSISPNGQLTREEATTLLVRYLGLLGSAKADVSSFTDYNQISSHFRDPVMIAVKAGLINGYQEKNGTYTFRPQNTLTRAEALTILYRAAGAVYNTSAYAKDSAAPADNAVITRGGVTLSGLKLNGRVIVTEGAAGDTVTLTGCTISGNLEVRGTSTLELNGCTIDSLVLDSDSAISINLSGNTRIGSITLNTRAAMNIASGCTVSNMIVNTDAKNVDIRGNGTIAKLTVYAAGFVSTMVPGEFYIASGLTANFASEPYTGSSDDQASFSMMPYMTEDNDQYYLNVTPDVSGRVYYYFTNLSHVPTAGEFDATYAAATYRDNFYVQSGKNYSEVTIDSAQAKKYDYVIVQLVTDSRSYAPVIIDNTPTSGTGFAVDPYFDGSDITYTADISGTVYYYYSKDGEDISSSQFQTGYRNADNAMKGTKDANSGRTGTIQLTERYLENYPFVIVVLKNLNDQYFKPIVIAAGDNGFSEEPEITTLGTIEFKTSVTGTLYYYYAKDDMMPTPNEFANDWRTEYGRGSMDVTRNRNASLKYETSYTDRYPYMVFCIKNSEGDYLTPFVLRIDHDTGFSVEPYISGNEEISFRAEHGGTVYWFFTKYNSVPSMDDFMDEYYETVSARRGYKIVNSTSMQTSFSFDASFVEQYPYIAIMLVDTSENTYQPVLVDVKNTTATGFSEDPFCDLTENAVYFKAAQSGTIYYYFSRTSNPYNESSEDFWISYGDATSGYYGSYPVSTSFDYIPFADVDTKYYPGIVLMLVDEHDHEFYPVYVSLTRDGSSGNSTTGVTILSVTGSEVKFSVDTTGVVKYYFMGYGINTTTHYDSGTTYAYKNGIVTIEHTGRYYSLVIEVEGYEPCVIDLTQDYDRDEDVNDGSNKSGYGFSNYDIEFVGGQIVITGIANVSGTITGSISNVNGSDSSVSVNKGDVFTLIIDHDVDKFMNGIGQLLGAGTLYVQLTSGSNVYERLSITLG